MDANTALAAVLGVGLGAFFLLAPAAVVRAYTAGRIQGQRGEYGTDEVPEKWALVVRVVGVALLLAGAYFAATALSLL